MSHQFITFCGQCALQEGVALGIDSRQDYYERLLADYSRKRNFFCEELRQLGFRVLVPEGTYYALVDIRPLGFEDDVAFCRMLPEKAGVAAIPCSAFYFSGNPVRHLVRFAFCKKDETLQESLRRLRAWKAGLRSAQRRQAAVIPTAPFHEQSANGCGSEETPPREAGSGST